MKSRRPIILLSTFLLVIFISCNLDQVENKYSDFKSAEKKGLFEKGWIPKEFVVESMTDIYLITNLDRNTCIFTFNTTENDIDRIKTKILPLESKSKNYITHYKQFIDSIEKLKHYFIVTNNKSDTVFIAIDDNFNRVFGWRN